MSKIEVGLVLVVVTVLAGCQITSSMMPNIRSPEVNKGANNFAVTQTESEGHLAYIGGDGNVYVTNADRTATMAVTNNATAPFEGLGLSYQRISWSPEGQLAYAAVTRSDDSTTSKLYVIETPDEAARLVGESNNHFVIYVYWSPVPCPGQPDCRQLAYLIEEDNNIVLRLVEMSSDRFENQVIGTGWPYYFSWAANGQSILWHTDGTHRFNDQAQIALYDLGQKTVKAFPQKPASFMAPAWSPRGDVWLGVSADSIVGDQLQLYGIEPPIMVAAVPKGGAAFAWSPSGDQVAYALRENSTDQFFGPIHIYDVNSGQSTQITDTGLHPVAFFWDPREYRIGYLTHLSMPGANWMQWRVYDLSQNKDRGFKAFNPSLHMRFVMSSFNQYAQSHRFWSPDGRYLVYGDLNSERNIEQVWLIDTWSDDGNNAILVDNGTMGFWSWN